MHSTPLLTSKVHERLVAALQAGLPSVECSLDLDRTVTMVEVSADGWSAGGRIFPYLQACKPRTIYYWTGAAFEPCPATRARS